MKTINSGRTHALPLGRGMVSPGVDARWARRRCLEAYRVGRACGRDDDRPRRDFPGDGNYSDWIEDTAKRDVDFKYWYITYTEGPKDREWMEECDRNYVMRLEREGRLDEVEPNLERERPALYREIMAMRREREERRRRAEVLKQRILTTEESLVRDYLSSCKELDFATFKETITQRYQQIRKQCLPEHAEVIKQLPLLKPLDLTLTKVLQGLKANQSLRMLSISGQQLHEVELQVLVQLIARSQTLKKLNLSGVKFNEISGRLLLEVIQHNSTITELDITATDLKPSIVAGLKVQLKRNASADTDALTAAAGALTLAELEDEGAAGAADSQKTMVPKVMSERKVYVDASSRYTITYPDTEQRLRAASAAVTGQMRARVVDYGGGAGAGARDDAVGAGAIASAADVGGGGGCGGGCARAAAASSE